MTNPTFTIGDKEISEALELWDKLVAGNKDDEFRSSKIDGYSIYKSAEAIKESREKDKTNFCTFLLLDAYFEDYISNSSYSIVDIIQDNPAILKTIELCKKLREKLSYAPVVEMRESFISGVRNALSSYGGLNDDTEKVLSNRFEMSYLLHSAITSIDKLQVDQFLRGESDPKGFKPAYNKSIYQFWDVEEMLAIGCNAPSGISLCLIRDPLESASHFAFMIRNGGNLFSLSDRPNDPHPLYKYRTRRPDRKLYGRIQENMFPYDLLDVKFDDEQRAAYVGRSDSKELITYGNTFDRMKPITDIDAYELVWTAIMFDLIKQRYWDDSFQCDEISYTGSMVKNENLLVSHAKKQNMPIALSEGATLSLPSLTVDDISSDAVTEEEVGKQTLKINLWMEDLYKGKIETNSIFNFVRDNSNIYLTTSSLTERMVEQASDIGHGISVISRDKHEADYFGSRATTEVFALERNHVGTKTKLDEDRKFLARHNYVREIQNLANSDYKDSLPKVKKKIYSLLDARKEFLLDMLREEKVVEYKRKSFGSEDKVSNYNFVKLYDLTSERFGGFWNHAPIRFAYEFKGDGIKKGYPTCYYTGAASTYMIVISPQTAEELGLMIGCDPSEIHPGLGNIYNFDIYSGNSILYRIDPFEKLKNPWLKMDRKVAIYLSKRGIKKFGFRTK